MKKPTRKVASLRFPKAPPAVLGERALALVRGGDSTVGYVPCITPVGYIPCVRPGEFVPCIRRP